MYNIVYSNERTIRDHAPRDDTGDDDMSNESKAIRSKKQRQLIETATDLFMRFGVKRITVEEICRTAGVSKMTFYKYYPNKMALVKSIWNGWAEEGFTRLEEIDAMDIPFREKLERIIEYKMGMLGKMSPAFMDEIIHGDPEMKQFIEHLQGQSIARFMEYIRTAQERGEMRGIRPEFFFAALDWLREIVQNDGLRRLYPSDVEFIREIHNFLFFGILPCENGEER